jgi:segregation and condensation protein B
MEQDQLKSIMESLLFVSGEPLKIAKIARISGSKAEEVESAVLSLQKDYAAGKRGFSLLRKEDEVQLATNTENTSFVSQLIKGEMQEGLSRAATEVLAIVAYRGPISRVEIEAIRGVNSSFTVRSLMLRGLMERIENPRDSRGYLYKISFDFLKKLGIDSVNKLPDFETLSKDERIDSIINS